VVAGRAFDATDDIPGGRNIIIDDWAARIAFGNENAVGRTLLARISTPQAEQYTVVGVVRHVRHSALVGEEKESVYFPAGTLGNFANAWMIRGDGDLNALASATRAALLQLDGQYLITNLMPQADYLDRAMAPTRFALGLITTFAVLAAVLASIGLYGVLSSLVRQRVNEIGVRMAFGAQPSSIFRMVVRQGMELSAIGVVVGLVGAFALTRFMTKLLVNVSPTDALTYGVMVVVFFAIAALASFLPARRAASVPPNQALLES
jgi:putative ABC transport system permease protein